MSAVSITTSNYQKWYERIIGGVLFLSIFDLKEIGLLRLNVLPILFLALVSVVVVGVVKKQLKFKMDGLSIAFIAFYLLYVFYALFTRHMDQASVYFENKLSFILLPIIFSFRPKFQINPAALIYGWVLGCAALSIASFIHAFGCYSAAGGSVSCFLASNFSYSHHPTYSSFYYTLAFFVAIYAYRQKVKGFSIIPALLFGSLMLMSIFLCISLAGLLFLMLAIAVFIFIWISKKWGKKVLLVSIVASPFLIYGLIESVPQIEGEWSNASWHAQQYIAAPDTYVKNCKPPHEGTQTRIIMWTVASAACFDYPMGVGTGNVDEVLAAYQRKYNQANMIPYAYNPHNQFLQTWLEIGLPGLITLLLIIGLSFVKALKTKNQLLLLVAGSLFFNCLFESMLQRQSGIFYYTVVLLLLHHMSDFIAPSEDRRSA